MARSDMDSAAATKGRVGLDENTTWLRMTLAEEDGQADIIICPKAPCNPLLYSLFQPSCLSTQESGYG